MRILTCLFTLVLLVGVSGCADDKPVSGMICGKRFVAEYNTTTTTMVGKTPIVRTIHHDDTWYLSVSPDDDRCSTNQEEVEATKIQFDAARVGDLWQAGVVPRSAGL